MAAHFSVVEGPIVHGPKELFSVEQNRLAEQLAIQSVSRDEAVITLSQDEWQFARSNVISRTARVSGAENVAIAGNSIIRSGVRIRGDLARVRIGRYCDIGCDAALRPPYRIDGDGASLSFLPMAIASHVIVGNGALIEAAWIGVGVRVGAYAIVGKSCVLKDFCVVAAGAIVPDDAVLAPMSIVRRTRPFSSQPPQVAGAPARVVGSMSPGAAAMRRKEAERRIRRILQRNSTKAGDRNSDVGESEAV